MTMKKTNHLNNKQNKMKHAITIVAVIFFTHSIMAQKADIILSVQKMNLKGKIWRIDEKKYGVVYENHQPQKGELKILQTYICDSDGNLISENYMNAEYHSFQ